MNDTPNTPQPSSGGDGCADHNQLGTCQETVLAAHNPAASRYWSWQTAFAVMAIVALTSTLSYSVGSQNDSNELNSAALKQVAGLSNPLMPATETADAAKMAYFYSGRVILLPAETLRGQSGSAPAWTFTAEGVDRKRFITSLGEAIGAIGDVRDEVWQLGVGALDGSGPNAWVGTDSHGYFGAYHPARSPWTCADTTKRGAEQLPLPADAERDSTVGGASESSAGSMTATATAPDMACSPSAASSPTADTARRVAHQFLEQVGINTDNFAVTVSPNDVSATVIYTATLQGYQLPWSISVEVGPDGVFSANGPLATTRPLPAYPIVDAVTAAKRSVDPRWSTLGPTPIWVGNQNWRGGTVPETFADADTAVSPTTRPVTTRDGRPVLEAPVTEKVVTSAEISLGQFTLHDGSSVLLPVWEFQAEDGSRWAMLAVEDNYVTFTNAG